jgi:hypothetical protein
MLIVFGLQNQNIVICTSSYSIGTTKQCDFILKDHTMGAIQCKIRHTQVLVVC